MNRKVAINKLFLYKHRFFLSYLLLIIFFAILIFVLPLWSPNGLSDAEMQSAAKSYDTNFSALSSGDVINLPYRALQKISILIFGFSMYSIKLPSMIIGIFLGILLIALLNKWFKRSIALPASILSLLSVLFFFLSGMGTPTIMFVFWPTLLLWLGGKIQHRSKDKKQTHPLYVILLAFALVLALFTPYMAYLVLILGLFSVFNPHLRLTIKKLPKISLIVAAIIVLGGAGLVGFYAARNLPTLTSLLFTQNFSINSYLANLNNALRPFFVWSGNLEGTLMAPAIGLACFALAIIGLIFTLKGFFASRNALASFLILFTALCSGFNPDFSVLLILPLTILIAHGLKYILEKWYGLFPTNPYARIFAIAPLSILIGIIVISDLTHFIIGYRYSPPVAEQFQNDLTLLQDNAKQGDILLLDKNSSNLRFYEIAGQCLKIQTTTEQPTNYTGHLITLGKWSDQNVGSIDRIVTSPKSNNSDRIYLYTAKTNEEEKK